MHSSPPETCSPAVSADSAALRVLAEQAYSRSAGAPLVGGNAIRLLRDAVEDYPARLAAIGAAGRSILVENYIVHDDAGGRQLAAVLAAQARRGPRLRVTYDA